ncbi:MAG: hypothetical protein GY870_17755 [archaeon]|nr:hypothetical protein [archaeon]
MNSEANSETESIMVKIYSFLTNPKVVRASTIIAFLATTLSMLFGYIVAQGDPDGYNMIQNFISDMGSIRHTPWPYFPRIKNLVSSVFLIPTILYMENLLRSSTDEKGERQKPSKMRLLFDIIGFLWMLFGLLGMFGLGVFREDDNMFIHLICTAMEFGGLTFGGIFYGFIITFYDTLMPKILGVYMIFVPTTLAFIFFFIGFYPIFEWILTFSILAYLMFGGLIILIHINRDLASK